MENKSLIISSQWNEYQLLDSGNKKKLERFGKYILQRPEDQAIWKPKQPQSLWENVHAILTPNRTWTVLKEIEDKWIMKFENLSFTARLTSFGHLGVFPEQSDHWNLINDQIKKADRMLNVLTIFGYTGIATLTAAAAGAKVTHVDASKPAINWAVENQKLSGLEQKPIRWLLDDGLKFVKREVRRGNKYDGIVIDPPKFGRGPKGEVWKFEDDFVELLENCKQLLSPNPEFFIITAYAISLSSTSLGTALSELMKQHQGKTEYGELGLSEQESSRFLPQAIFARWSKS